MALALECLPSIPDSRVLVGHNNADDAGVFTVDDDLALVTTVDLLAPVVDDPHEFGYIAATNCLSDIYAMGGEPLVCMNIVGWPTAMPSETLGEILKGSQAAVVAAGAAVVGGHSYQDSEIRYGLSVTGRIDPARIFKNSAARAGDVLVLSKPLGTGTVVQCAISRGAAPGDSFRAVTDSMKTSNAIPAKAMREVDASACTDITGFGFLGHCWEMAEGSGLGIVVHTSRLPLFPNVVDLVREGIVDGSHKMNRNSFRRGVRFEASEPIYETVLYSSETSGGLLISVHPESVDPLLAAL
ncbi:MAG: selenide, water dikinase SelD, partial [Phycisphaeraceae bacterium]|nr:selenide, water dikinase SelD [Phycisphaeraceae bacterium]